MNQHDQMLREALRNNIRGFFNKETGRFKFVLLDAECHGNWKEMMLIPNLSDEVIDSVLSHVNETPKNEHGSDDMLKRAPLVRLTNEEIDAAFSEADKNCMNDRRFAVHFANAIMDAFLQKNGADK